MSGRRDSVPAPDEPLLPQDIDAEQATLGSMLLEPEAASIVFSIIGTPDDFYRLYHQDIYRAFLAVRRRNEPVDLVTLSAELRRTGKLEEVGGGEYLTALIGQVATASHVRRYANLVAEKAFLRRMISITQAASGECMKSPANVLEPYNTLQQRLQQLLEERLADKAGLQTIQERGDDLERLVLRAIEGRRPLSSARLGVQGLDDQIGPLSDHRIVIIKAREGVGKTHIAVNAATETAHRFAGDRSGKRVAIFSFESAGMYQLRMLAHIGGIDSNILRLGFDGAEQVSLRRRLEEAKDILKSLPVSILEGTASEDDVETQLRRHMRKYDIGMVVLDYWQGMTRLPGRSGVEELETMAIRFRDIAEKLGCPFIIPAQVTLNPATGELQCKGSRTLQEVCTLDTSLQRDKDKKQPNKYWLKCNKAKIGVEFGERPIRLDKTMSKVYLYDQTQETLPEEEPRRGRGSGRWPNND